MSTSGRGRASSPTSSGRRTCCRREFAARHGGDAKWTSLRPEKIGVFASGSCVRRRRRRSADGEIKMISYQGAVTRFSVEAGETRLSAAVPAGATELQARATTVRLDLAASRPWSPWRTAREPRGDSLDRTRRRSRPDLRRLLRTARSS